MEERLEFVSMQSRTKDIGLEASDPVQSLTLLLMDKLLNYIVALFFHLEMRIILTSLQDRHCPLC